MSTQNFDLVLQGYDAFSRVTFHRAGDSTQISRMFPGAARCRVITKATTKCLPFSKTCELSAGTFSIEINDVLANGQPGGAVHRVCAADRPALVITAGGPCLARGHLDKPWNFVNTRATSRPRTSSGPGTCPPGRSAGRAPPGLAGQIDPVAQAPPRPSWASTNGTT